MEWFGKFLSVITPVKSVFGLYKLMFAVPLIICAFVIFNLSDDLVKENGELNLDIAIFVAALVILVLAWAAYFLHYFTKNRNERPELYQQGFIDSLEYGVKKNTDE